ncbi:MAG: hypothetical protein V3S07_03515, partial [Micropepsaceae bacterium]
DFPSPLEGVEGRLVIGPVDLSSPEACPPPRPTVGRREDKLRGRMGGENNQDPLKGGWNLDKTLPLSLSAFAKAPADQ